MSDLKEFGNGSSQYHGKESDLLEEDWYLNLEEILTYLETNKTFHVRILSGDYEGSIAKFTLDDGFVEHLKRKPTRLYCRDKVYNYQYYFSGRLSWKGKRNNPKFTVTTNTCDVLLSYEGQEVFNKYDLKKEGELLLKQQLKILVAIK